MKAILATMLLVMTMSAHSMSPRQLEDAIIVGTAPCVVHGEELICIVVEKNDKKYAIAGYLKGDEFFARYVGMMTDKGWVTVWKYGNQI